MNKDKDKYRIIHKDGQPYGIRDDGGYILQFIKVRKWHDQEERYIKELQELFALSKKIVDCLNETP